MLFMRTATRSREEIRFCIRLKRVSTVIFPNFSELSELAIHTLLVESRARDLDREMYQDPDSDRYLIPSEKVFGNAADDLETIAVSKRSISLLPQKEEVRTDL